MLPEVLREPCAAGLPDAVVRGIDGSRTAPQVEVVMQDPAARVVVFLRGRRAGRRQFFQRRRTAGGGTPPVLSPQRASSSSPC